MKFLREFRDDTRGAATIEFVLLFPAIMSIFFIGIETGVYMLRNTMLERAVDVSLREVRLNNGAAINYNDLKEQICDETRIVSDCVSKLQIELRPISLQPGGVAALGNIPRCIDIDSTNTPLSETNYDTAASNNLMLLRACLLARPFFPSALLGTGMQVDRQGNYALVVTSAFVNEPQNALAAAAPDGSYLAPVDNTGSDDTDTTEGQGTEEEVPGSDDTTSNDGSSGTGDSSDNGSNTSEGGTPDVDDEGGQDADNGQDEGADSDRESEETDGSEEGGSTTDTSTPPEETVTPPVELPTFETPRKAN